MRERSIFCANFRMEASTQFQSMQGPPEQRSIRTPTNIFGRFLGQPRMQTTLDLCRHLRAINVSR